MSVFTPAACLRKLSMKTGTCTVLVSYEQYVYSVRYAVHLVLRTGGTQYAARVQ